MADSDKINPVPPVTPSQPSSTKQEEPGVMLPQSKINELLHAIEELRKNDAEKSKEIERLRYAADKNRIARFDSTEANKKSLVPKCTVSYWDDKVVKAWRMLEQEVYFGPNGVYHEKQDVEMYVMGEPKPLIIAYKDWFKKITKKNADILSRTIDNDGHTIITVELEDGNQIALDSNFIN